MPRLKTGIVQIYTGNGKGKTSAAFGLALRAVGRGLKVCIVQFIKGGFDYGELHSAARLPSLTLKAFGRGRFVTTKPPETEDVELAQRALSTSQSVVKSGDYDIVVLDEINVALDLGLIDLDSVLKLVKEKPKHVELVLTGRSAKDELVKVADLVTEMREIKHPYSDGFEARRGIEY